jgi:hypothetical protein
MTNKINSEYDQFSKAMDTILKAKPEAVKAAMEADKEQRKRARKAKKVSKSNDKQDS